MPPISEPRPSLALNRRILVIDDNEAIRADFVRLLGHDLHQHERLDEDLNKLAAQLFGEDDPSIPMVRHTEFDVATASQGQQGVRMAVDALREGRPFALVFVDMRMPPGWDGLRTVKELWAVDPQLEVVICSAYSDHDRTHIIEELGENDQLLFLNKPFDGREVIQLAHALTHKWSLRRAAERTMTELEERVSERTAELRRVNEQLSRVIHERQELARNIQETLNPLPVPVSVAEVCIAGTCQTCEECGGDWWTYQELPSGRLLVAVGDVTGHGVPATMIAAAARGAVSVLVEEDPELTATKVLSTLDRIVSEIGRGRFWMTCVVAIFEPVLGELVVANAGHTLPFLVRKEKDAAELHSLLAQGNPLGSPLRHFRERRYPMHWGDIIVFYSDGVTEHRNPEGQLFGEKRLRALLKKRQSGSGISVTAQLRDALLGAIRHFGGDTPPEDDLTLVLCQYMGPPAAY